MNLGCIPFTFPIRNHVRILLECISEFFTGNIEAKPMRLQSSFVLSFFLCFSSVHLRTAIQVSIGHSVVFIFIIFFFYLSMYRIEFLANPKRHKHHLSILILCLFVSVVEFQLRIKNRWKTVGLNVQIYEERDFESSIMNSIPFESKCILQNLGMYTCWF